MAQMTLILKIECKLVSTLIKIEEIQNGYALTVQRKYQFWACAKNTQPGYRHE